MTVVPDVERRSYLTPGQVSDVMALLEAASDADGVYPLSEHVVLHLRHGGDTPAVHLLVRDGKTVIGYAHVDPSDVVVGPSAELAVHPAHRRRGWGRALGRAAIAVAEEHDPRGRLRLWAHGDHPSAAALAMGFGFERYRVLWQMRRSLYAPTAVVPLPEEYALRAFVPGKDDEAWLELNNRAFADHPDQGRWTLRDLQVRLAEPWFDPNGFLLAERTGSGRLAGFHWTKVHGTGATDGGTPHAHNPIGEVYVLGVDPDEQGSGLAVPLTLAGLRHLRAHGLEQVMLYVDESNTRATRLYERLGFVRWITDVAFRRVGRPM
ncbi:MAG: mycothiol synthase [Micromonosporaceae bacterium]